MCTTTVPATAAEALAMLESALGMQESALGFLAAQDAVALPAQAAADRLRALERHDAIEAAVRARLLAVFDARDGHLADGQRSTRAWLVHSTRVTKGQAGEYQAIQALARGHQVLLATWPRDTSSSSRSPCNWPSGPKPSRMSTGTRQRKSWSPPPGSALACTAAAPPATGPGRPCAAPSATWGRWHCRTWMPR
jgi:hypothetical protein